MSAKINLRLLASTKMSDKHEHGLIRFPKRARQGLGLANSMVVIGKGPYQIALETRKAYKKDIQRLATMLRQGKLSDDEAAAVGFVTRSTQQRINRREGGSAWVSDGIGHITIGADPEFGLIRDDGILVRGNHVLPNAGKFGSDGPGIEVRPPPNNNHIKVVQSMEEILRNPPGEADHYRWKGGATHTDPQRTYWFGGHIHLGRPLQIAPADAYGCYEKIATILDGLLAFPLVKWDTENPHLRRNGCVYDYGKAGDIRADYPEQDRFEYRVLSGLWLVHPTLARIILGSAKAITESAYGRIANSKYDYEWAHAGVSKKSLVRSFGIKGFPTIRTAINTADPARVTADMLVAWEKQLREIDCFDEYKEELEALIAITKAPREQVTQMSLDIKANWYNENTLLPEKSADLGTALEAVEAK